MLITISRQFSSGGSTVAKHVAGSLGWDVVDNAFIDTIAERAGLPREEVALREERAPSFLDRMSLTTALAFPEMFGPATSSLEDLEEAKLVKITRNLVSELAAEGRMVLVGRAAAAVLAEAEDTLHVLLVAPRAHRIQVASETWSLSAEEAEQLLDDKDQNRERYYREYYDREWQDATNYDLTLNTARLGYEGAAALIVARARSLGW